MHDPHSVTALQEGMRLNAKGTFHCPANGLNFVVENRRNASAAGQNDVDARRCYHVQSAFESPSQEYIAREERQ